MKLQIQKEVLLKPLQNLCRIVEVHSSMPILKNFHIKAIKGMVQISSTDIDMLGTTSIRTGVNVDESGEVTCEARMLRDLVKEAPKGAMLAFHTTTKQIEYEEQVKDAHGALTWITKKIKLKDAKGKPVLDKDGNQEIREDKVPKMKKFKRDQVTLHYSNGAMQTDIPTLLPDTFPFLEIDAVPDVIFHMKAHAFLDLIKSTMFAISSEDSRYYLNGVYLHCGELVHVRDKDGKPKEDKDGKVIQEVGEFLKDDNDNFVLRAVTTDGHRLAFHQLPRPEFHGMLPPVIIPKKMCKEIVKWLDKETGSVVIEASKKRFLIKIGSTNLLCKVIDGTFPEYTRVIPKTNEGKLIVNRESLLSVLNTIRKANKDPVQAVRMEPKGDKLKIEYSNPASGKITNTLDCEYEGDNSALGFNCNYMLDVCKELNSEKVLMKIPKDGDYIKNPAIFQAADVEHPFYVVMPMRV